MSVEDKTRNLPQHPVVQTALKCVFTWGVGWRIGGVWGITWYNCRVTRGGVTAHLATGAPARRQVGRDDSKWAGRMQRLFTQCFFFFLQAHKKVVVIVSVQNVQVRIFYSIVLSNVRSLAFLINIPATYLLTCNSAADVVRTQMKNETRLGPMTLVGLSAHTKGRHRWRETTMNQLVWKTQGSRDKMRICRRRDQAGLSKTSRVVSRKSVQG